jgi:hypothetical protein
MVVPSRCLSGRQRGRWLAKAPDQGPATTSDWSTSANATRVISWRHQAGPSAPRPPAAGAGPAAGASARPGRGWPLASPDGWRPWREARGPRSAPQDPSGSGSSSPPVIPSRMPLEQRWNQTQRCPKGPPGGGRAFACEGSCGFMRCRAGRRPIERAMGVCSTGCALRLVRVAHAAAPSFSPGAARSGIARGPDPQQTRHPRPHPSPLGGPVHGSCPRPGAGKRRAGQVRRNTQR